MLMDFFFVALRNKSHLGSLIVEVSRSHTIRHTHTHTHTDRTNLLWTCDQLVEEAFTYTTHNKRKRWKSIPSAGSEHAIQANKQLQTYALERSAIGIGSHITSLHFITKSSKIL